MLKIVRISAVSWPSVTEVRYIARKFAEKKNLRIKMLLFHFGWINVLCESRRRTELVISNAALLANVCVTSK